MLDLDADPVAVDEQLRTDPLLAPLVDKAPGRRVPCTVDAAEFAVRAVLGQQVSTAAARTHAARLVSAHGVPVDDPEGGLTHLFPAPEALAGLDPEALALPRTRRTTLITLIAALADGSLRLGTDSDWEQARERLIALPGFGPWTVEAIAMRALGDPDAFLPTDLGVRRAAERLGLPSTPGAPRSAPRLATVARVRRAVPLGDRRPRHQPPSRISLFSVQRSAFRAPASVQSPSKEVPSWPDSATPCTP